jgi:hypothetical protein
MHLLHCYYVEVLDSWSLKLDRWILKLSGVFTSYIPADHWSNARKDLKKDVVVLAWGTC